MSSLWCGLSYAAKLHHQAVVYPCFCECWCHGAYSRGGVQERPPNKGKFSKSGCKTGPYGAFRASSELIEFVLIATCKQS